MPQLFALLCSQPTYSCLSQHVGCLPGQACSQWHVLHVPFLVRYVSWVSGGQLVEPAAACQSLGASVVFSSLKCYNESDGIIFIQPMLILQDSRQRVQNYSFPITPVCHLHQVWPGGFLYGLCTWIHQIMALSMRLALSRESLPVSGDGDSRPTPWTQCSGSC